MKNGLTRERLEELYLPAPDDFVMVRVPKMRFLMIDGAGSPDGELFATSLKWLFAVLMPIKRLARERMGKHYIDPPLEGLWWADDLDDFIAGNRSKLKWRLMIPATPDWITKSVFNRSVTAASERLGEPPGTLRLETYAEGRSLQIMHIGDPRLQRKTMMRLHGEYMPQHGLACNGPHHEIYLTDPNRVELKRQRTVLRQPVSRLG